MLCSLNMCFFNVLCSKDCLSNTSCALIFVDFLTFGDAESKCIIREPMQTQQNIISVLSHSVCSFTCNKNFGATKALNQKAALAQPRAYAHKEITHKEHTIWETKHKRRCVRFSLLQIKAESKLTALAAPPLGNIHPRISEPCSNIPFSRPESCPSPGPFGRHLSHAARGPGHPQKRLGYNLSDGRASVCMFLLVSGSGATITERSLT